MRYDLDESSSASALQQVVSPAVATLVRSAILASRTSTLHFDDMSFQDTLLVSGMSKVVGHVFVFLLTRLLWQVACALLVFAVNPWFTHLFVMHLTVGFWSGHWLQCWRFKHKSPRPLFVVAPSVSFTPEVAVVTSSRLGRDAAAAAVRNRLSVSTCTNASLATSRTRTD